MDEAKIAVARRCLAAAADDGMNFPEIVGTLIGAGFESYAVDFRRSTAIYYLPDGDSVELATHEVAAPVAAAFDASAIAEAIGEAQRQAPGYSYHGFCKKIVRAGCAAYLVSFPGRRAVYIGRTGEMHVECFSD